MDIDKLKLYVTLAETLNFNRASELCHISPSTLSRNIQQMEQQLNARLFDRDNRTVLLTQQGRAFLSFAKEIVQQWETARDAMQVGADHLRGSISIYCSVTASYSFLYDILSRFRIDHPAIEITLHTGDPALAINRVMAGEEDIAIAAKLPTMPTGVRFKRFTVSPLVFITAANENALTPRKRESPADLWQRIPLIISEQGLARQRLNTWFRQQNIQPNIYAQVAGNEAIVSMVSLGLGVGLVPKIVMDNSPLADKIKLFARQPKLEPFDVGLCVLEKRLKSPLVNAFWTQV